MTPTAQETKEKIDNLNFIKIKNFPEHQARKLKKKQNGRKILEIIYQIRDLYLKYIKTLTTQL